MRQWCLRALIVFTVSSLNSILFTINTSSNYGDSGVTAACKTVDLEDRVRFSAIALSTMFIKYKTGGTIK